MQLYVFRYVSARAHCDVGVEKGNGNKQRLSRNTVVIPWDI
jgi:hypothetical protein